MPSTIHPVATPILRGGFALLSRLRRVVDGRVAAYLLRCQIAGMAAARRRNAGQAPILGGAAMLYRFDSDIGA